MHNQEYGLTTSEVLESRRHFGRNELDLHRSSGWAVLIRQLANPLLLILAAAAVVSYLFGDSVNASIILGIILLSVGLGFINEYSSERTVDGLLKRISLSALVIRNGVKQDVPVGDIVVGDIVLLHQGTVVPADAVLLSINGLAVDESALTGESAPVRKEVTSDNSKSGRVCMGTVVMNGSGMAKVEAIAHDTEFGRISASATASREKTAFQKGLAHLSVLMGKVIGVMAAAICIMNILLGKDPLQAVLFALAVAIGLTPALLPVIVTVSMAHGARRLGKKRVIVKELVSIEDLGNVDVLCTDKTGTLTEGDITLTGTYDMGGKESRVVLERSLACNTACHHHRIVGNPMDAAIWHYAIKHGMRPGKQIKKLAEEEFNYDYRGEYVVMEENGQPLIIFKGASDAVLARCSTLFDAHGQSIPLTPAKRKQLQEKMFDLNRQGLRLIVVAERLLKKKSAYSIDDAQDMRLIGYLTFQDVAKISAKHALSSLQVLGVSLKILTGDNEHVTEKICQDLGIKIGKILTGPELAAMNQGQILAAVKNVTAFARISPEQKEQIVHALKRIGKTVAYLGDGINDVGALHAADVGISVNQGVDVAKDVADVVLLHKGLEVIAEGVQEGRRIFANTIKYILMGTSSNFGNMFSVAGASLFLPFLPMTPSQILLNNSMYDLSQLGIPGDDVDPEILQKPHHWNLKAIYKYMLFFGPISSLFDFLSFGMLWYWFHGSASAFQTGWFLESIATQVLVVFVIRTSRYPFYRSRPALMLSVLCGSVLALAFALPYTGAARYLAFMPMPAAFLGALVLLVVAYLVVVDAAKGRFLRRLAL